MKKQTVKPIQSIIFLGEEITDQIIFNTTDNIIFQSLLHEEVVSKHGNNLYFRVYDGDRRFSNYQYIFIPIKRFADHKTIDLKNLPKPYFTITKERGIELYD